MSLSRLFLLKVLPVARTDKNNESETNSKIATGLPKQWAKKKKNQKFITQGEKLCANSLWMSHPFHIIQSFDLLLKNV